MDGKRIMPSCHNTGFFEMMGKCVAALAANYIEVVNMLATSPFRRNHDREVQECIVIASGDRAPVAASANNSLP